MAHGARIDLGAGGPRKSWKAFWSSPRGHRLILALVFLAVLPFVGTLGLVIIEGWPVFDAFYMAVTTLTTVGFGEIHPLRMQGRAFILVYLIAGLGMFLYALTVIGETALELSAERPYWRRKMDKKIESLDGHVIVCGFGRMGRRVCEGLASRGQKFVILECSADAMTSAHALGWPCVVGDATQDDLLERCRIDRAQGLVAALASDADNLLVVLTARLLNADVRIVSRVIEEHNIRKLARAGAQEVICLYHTGAERLVEKVLNVGGNV